MKKTKLCRVKNGGLQYRIDAEEARKAADDGVGAGTALIGFWNHNKKAFVLYTSLAEAVKDGVMAYAHILTNSITEGFLRFSLHKLPLKKVVVYGS